MERFRQLLLECLEMTLTRRLYEGNTSKPFILALCVTNP